MNPFLQTLLLLLKVSAKVCFLVLMAFRNFVLVVLEVFVALLPTADRPITADMKLPGAWIILMVLVLCFDDFGLIVFISKFMFTSSTKVISCLFPIDSPRNPPMSTYFYVPALYTVLNHSCFAWTLPSGWCSLHFRDLLLGRPFSLKLWLQKQVLVRLSAFSAAKLWTHFRSDPGLHQWLPRFSCTAKDFVPVESRDDCTNQSLLTPGSAWGFCLSDRCSQMFSCWSRSSLNMRYCLYLSLGLMMLLYLLQKSMLFVSSDWPGLGQLFSNPKIRFNL